MFYNLSKAPFDFFWMFDFLPEDNPSRFSRNTKASLRPLPDRQGYKAPEVRDEKLPL